MTYEIPLSHYIKSKLNMQLNSYSKASGIPVSTLQSRWKTERGRQDIENAVYKMYIKRFDDL